MEISAFLVQAINGLAGASSLFLVAAGLSLIFGVTRVVNFAHGSFFMLGVYLAYSLVAHASPWLRPYAPNLVVFFALVFCAGLVTGAVGAAFEVVILRRIYQAPELFQLLATFALALVVQDATLWLWGPEDLLGPRAPGLEGAVNIFGRLIPSYDLFLMGVGPLVLWAIWYVLRHSRFGLLVRAATQDREMLGALGINPRYLFTSVFALGCALAGWGGALQLPREPAHVGLDMVTISDAFVVVVVGGMGSIPGAFIAALLISEVKALCIAVGTVELGGLSIAFSKLTLVAEFVVMALVLMIRPWGLLGKPMNPSRTAVMQAESSAQTATANGVAWMAWLTVLTLALMWPMLMTNMAYGVVLGIDVLIAILFAASLHFIMGPAGLHSFGHAAYFGIGAYAAALLVLREGLGTEQVLWWAPLISAACAMPLAWFAVRLSGVYLAMLTLAFAQIVWSICFQWDDLTGGSNGLNGVWPDITWQDKSSFYWLAFGLTVVSVLVLQHILRAPMGYAMRASRDAPMRAQAIGLNIAWMQWWGFVISAGFAGLAGALFAFSKGSISPDVMGIPRSVDALVMVLLGGIHATAGPIVGAFSFTVLQDTLARSTDYWRALLGGVILLLVLVFPHGIAGTWKLMGRKA